MTADAWFKEFIVNVVGVGTVKTWNNLSSKSLAFNPVPLGKVTDDNSIISPTDKSWSVLVVIVQVLTDVLFVASVELVKESTTPALLHLKGVISKSWPSKYNNKNLSVPSATYLLPSVSTKACCFLATPTIESLSNDCQPPTFQEGHI